MMIAYIVSSLHLHLAFSITPHRLLPYPLFDINRLRHRIALECRILFLLAISCWSWNKLECLQLLQHQFGIEVQLCGVAALLLTPSVLVVYYLLV